MARKIYGLLWLGEKKRKIKVQIDWHFETKTKAAPGKGVLVGMRNSSGRAEINHMAADTADSSVNRTFGKLPF